VRLTAGAGLAYQRSRCTAPPAPGDQQVEHEDGRGQLHGRRQPDADTRPAAAAAEGEDVDGDGDEGGDEQVDLAQPEGLPDRVRDQHDRDAGPAQDHSG